MKKISTLMLFAASISISCHKQFLEENPTSFLGPETYYVTAEHAIGAVTTIYDNVSHNDTYKLGIFDLVDMSTDQASKGLSISTTDQYFWDASSGTPYDYWSRVYEGVFKANVALEKIPGINMNESLKNRLLAESHFLRAFFYFDLIKLFGNIPLYDKATSSIEMAYQTNVNTHQQVWDLIISDLKFAEDKLPLASTYAGADIGRASKDAAKGLLAKVYLQRSGLAKYAPNPDLWGVKGVDEWALAEAKAKEVIGADGRRVVLLTDYSKVFDLATKNGPEHLFSGQNALIAGYNEQAGSLVQDVGVAGIPAADPYNGRSLFTSEKKFYATFSPTDKRIPATFITQFTRATCGAPVIYPSTLLPVPHIRKYLIRNEQFPDRPSRTAINVPILRYADVLLMHSEASNEGGQGDPYMGINLVRARAGLPLLSGLGREGLRQAIIKERGFELCFEGQAFFDYQRHGIVQQKAAQGDRGYTGVEAFRYVYAIPQAEINVNALLRQNPGF